MAVPRRAVRYLAAAGAVLGAMSCTSERDSASAGDVGVVVAATTEAPRIESVAMIGDSITVGAEVALRAALERLDVDVIAIDADSGRRMIASGAVASGLEAAARVARREPDLWAVALGTNDVGIYAGAEEYRAAIDELLLAIPEEVPLLWVDIYVDVAAEQSDEFNESLAEALDERGNTSVVEWSAVAADRGMLSDGIHPSEAGVDAFASLVATGVAEWLT